jgi:hypothetical protein
MDENGEFSKQIYITKSEKRKRYSEIPHIEPLSLTGVIIYAA